MSKKFVYKEGVTKKYEVLKEAMKYLNDRNDNHPKDKYEFICHCINKVVNKSTMKFYDKTGLLEIIRTRLEGYQTFNTWLERKGKISMKLQNKDQGRKLQYTRMQWMKSMYEEFKSKDE